MRQLALDIGVGRGPTLANFMAGPNEAVVQHLRLWIGHDGGPGQALRSPVPTYLWGPPTSGKTHLLQAVRTALLDQGAAVGWLDASIAEPPPYDERWAAVLFDDVHLYTAVQQHAAFSWFVQAQTAHQWVLAAGTQPPANLQLREDLRTRLGWGHVYGLEVLDEAARRAVLRQAADARGIFLGDEVMDYILHRFTRDLGSLMMLLDELDAYALAAQRGVTIPLLKAMLHDD